QTVCRRSLRDAHSADILSGTYAEAVVSTASTRQSRRGISLPRTPRRTHVARQAVSAPADADRTQPSARSDLEQHAAGGARIETVSAATHVGRGEKSRVFADE